MKLITHINEQEEKEEINIDEKTLYLSFWDFLRKRLTSEPNYHSYYINNLGELRINKKKLYDKINTYLYKCRNIKSQIKTLIPIVFNIFKENNIEEIVYQDERFLDSKVVNLVTEENLKTFIDTLVSQEDILCLEDIRSTYGYLPDMNDHLKKLRALTKTRITALNKINKLLKFRNSLANELYYKAQQLINPTGFKEIKKFSLKD